MIVDCHTHIEPDADDAALAAHRMAAEMVDACIVLARPGPDRRRINEQLSHYVLAHKDKMIGFGLLEPTQDQITEKELTAFKKRMGLKGIVLYCDCWGLHPMHSRAVDLYGLAVKVGFPVFFHNPELDQKASGNLTYAQPYLIDEVAAAFPQLKIVIGGMGVPFLEQTLAVLARRDNVYADLSIRPNRVWQTYNTVMAAYDYGVMHKLLFGSGYPSYSPADCIETLLGFNMLMADTSLPTVPRSSISSVVERDALEVLGIEHDLP
ncbi:MAG: amidohydrolase family protein [Sedimentisphaerales bacterium]|jgi:predicted TIM-barrel fold metal-dependent hydrolase|nr:amidohydrolase family protein [Sedimentisphaerales bacterium]